MSTCNLPGGSTGGIQNFKGGGGEEKKNKIKSTQNKDFHIYFFTTKNIVLVYSGVTFYVGLSF
jgi:hypothetical protein